MTEVPRYIRLSMTTHAASTATMQQQGLFEKRGWRRWLARVLRQSTLEWRDINTSTVRIEDHSTSERTRS